MFNPNHSIWDQLYETIFSVTYSVRFEALNCAKQGTCLVRYDSRVVNYDGSVLKYKIYCSSSLQ